MTEDMHEERLQAVAALSDSSVSFFNLLLTVQAYRVFGYLEM